MIGNLNCIFDPNTINSYIIMSIAVRNQIEPLITDTIISMNTAIVIGKSGMTVFLIIPVIAFIGTGLIICFYLLGLMTKPIGIGD